MLVERGKAKGARVLVSQCAAYRECNEEEPHKEEFGGLIVSGLTVTVLPASFLNGAASEAVVPYHSCPELPRKLRGGACGNPLTDLDRELIRDLLAVITAAVLTDLCLAGITAASQPDGRHTAISGR